LAIINIQLEKTQISARTPGHWSNRKVVKSMPLTSRLSSRCPLREDESYRRNEDSEGNDYTLYTGQVVGSDGDQNSKRQRL